MNKICFLLNNISSWWLFLTQSAYWCVTTWLFRIEHALSFTESTMSVFQNKTQINPEHTLLSSVLCLLQLPPRHLSNAQTHSVAQHAQEPFSADCAGRSAGGNTLSGFLHASNIISTGFVCSHTPTCPNVINVDPKHERSTETGSIWN